MRSTIPILFCLMTLSIAMHAQHRADSTLPQQQRVAQMAR